MTRRQARRLAGGLLLTGLSLYLAASVLSFAHDRHDFLLGLYVGLATIPFMVTGSIVIAQLPRHPIGWLLWMVGFFQALPAFSDAWSDYRDGGLPLAREAQVGSVATYLSLGMAISLLPLLFPSGRPPSPRWRWAGWTAATGIVALAVGVFASAWLQRVDPITDAPTSDAPIIWQVFFGGGGLLMLAGAGASVVSVVVRLRRARGVERQQMKWFTFAIVVTLLVAISAVTPLSLDGAWFDVELGVCFMVVAVAIAISMLRYKLYEIDRLINRALVYGSLTALLLGTYALLVVALQSVLDPLTSGSDLAVAGSTLAVAALFSPARRRVQQVVDRRFYRRRYDAARTLNGFSERLRDQIDLDTLSAELRSVVQETMQPSHVSLWLRAPR